MDINQKGSRHMPTPQCMINCIFCDTSFSLLHESAAVRDVSEIESHLICALSGRSDVVAALCEAAHVAAEVNVPRIIARNLNSPPLNSIVPVHTSESSEGVSAVEASQPPGVASPITPYVLTCATE